MVETQTTPVEGRRERKKRELRERIYQVARDLFRRNGFAATTVEQIAEAADVAPATFFNHFQSKNGLLREMTFEVFDRLQTLIHEWLLRPGSTRERIDVFIDHAARDIEESRGLAHDVLLELMRTGARPGAAVPYLSRVHEAFVTVIEEGQARGEVRTDLDAMFLAEMVVGSFNAAVINWLNDPEYPLERRLRQTGRFIVEAIAPQPSPPS
jgi:AcrR family transcriptional regulator